MPKTEKYFHRQHTGCDYFIRVNRDVWIMLDAYARITDTTKMIAADSILRRGLALGFGNIAGFTEEDD